MISASWADDHENLEGTRGDIVSARSVLDTRAVSFRAAGGHQADDSGRELYERAVRTEVALEELLRRRNKLVEEAASRRARAVVEHKRDLIRAGSQRI